MRWLLLSLAFAQPVAAAALSSPEPLAKAYELILDARFGEATNSFARPVDHSPDGVSSAAGRLPVLAAAVSTLKTRAMMKLFWQKRTSRLRRPKPWTAREPKRAEAWFYTGGCLRHPRDACADLREQSLAAARDGKRIHDALHQAVALDPALQDAYFGLGLYHYYAAIAPAAARVLRFLLLLPAGDRAGGLKEMQQTRSRGMLLRGEADYQLHLIYLWYERQTIDALKLVEGLRDRYPHNPVFYLRLADRAGRIPRKRIRRRSRPIASLLDARARDESPIPAMSEVNARLGMAQEMDALCDTDRAIEQVRDVIAREAYRLPYGALARAHYQLGWRTIASGRRSDAIVGVSTRARRESIRRSIAT